MSLCWMNQNNAFDVFFASLLIRCFSSVSNHNRMINNQVDAHFVEQIAQMGKHRLNKKDGIAPVATGNWGCGQTSQGDVQLKLVIQWMAASLAGVPVLIYNTSGDDKLTKVSIHSIFVCYFVKYNTFS